MKHNLSFVKAPKSWEACSIHTEKEIVITCRYAYLFTSNVEPTRYTICDTKENLWHAYNLDIVPCDIHHGQNIALRLDKEGGIIEIRVLSN